MTHIDVVIDVDVQVDIDVDVDVQVDVNMWVLCYHVLDFVTTCLNYVLPLVYHFCWMMFTIVVDDVNHVV
jgi:hypothetical protein